MSYFEQRKRPTPFAADSGFAASGYAPQASKGCGKRRCLACPAAAAKTNRWADAQRLRLRFFFLPQTA
jgi:hypothetical protein